MAEPQERRAGQRVGRPHERIPGRDAHAILAIFLLPVLLAAAAAFAACHAWAMSLLTEALARPAWIAAVAFGRVVSSFYGLYSTGHLWNVFGVEPLATSTIGVVLLRNARRRNSGAALTTWRINQRPGGRRYQK